MSDSEKTYVKVSSWGLLIGFIFLVIAPVLSLLGVQDPTLGYFIKTGLFLFVVGMGFTAIDDIKADGSIEVDNNEYSVPDNPESILDEED